MTAELTDSWKTLRLIKESKPDYIFHFAAQAFNSLSFDDPEYTLNTNMMSTLNILEAVRELGRANSIKILVAGSSTVYGSSTEQWDGPIPEEAPMQPVSPYGVSKAATELLTLQYTRTHKVHAVVARFFIHLAPRGVEALALHEFARQIALIERGLQEPVIKHGDISTSRDITDIVDSAPVVACVAEVAESGTVVNVGSNISYTMSDLLDRAIGMSRVPNIALVTDPSRLRAYDERVVMADISRLKSITGWQPRPDMDHLIRELLEYWRREIAFRHPLAENGRIRNEL
jgi:nucleoside-diphosphate-sugar epimerase